MPQRDITPKDEAQITADLDLAAELGKRIVDHVGEDLPRMLLIASQVTGLVLFAIPEWPVREATATTVAEQALGFARAFEEDARG